MIFGYCYSEHSSHVIKKSTDSIHLQIGQLFLSDFRIFQNVNTIFGYSGQISNLKNMYQKFECSDELSLFEKLSREDESFYRHFYGPFLFFVFDKIKKKLQIVNNNHQSSSLYYLQKKGGIYFSNYIEDLIPHLESVDVFRPSVRSFVANGFTVSDQTQLSGIKKLLPSFVLSICDKQINLLNHWPEEYRSERIDFDDLEVKLDEYEGVFQKTIQEYLEQRSSENLGALLSGGHDTSFCLIQTQKIYREKIDAYTVTFPDWNFSEGDYARNIAEKVGAQFNPISLTQDHLDHVVDMVRGVEEPAVGVALPLQVLAMEARKNRIDTIIGGDGGDTLWGEYFPVAEIHRYIKNYPLWMRQGGHRAANFLAKTLDWERLWELEHVLSLFANKDDYKNFMSRLCTYRHFRRDEQQSLFNSDFYGDGSISESIFEVEFNKKNFSEALIEGKLYNAFYTYMGFSQTKLFKAQGIDFFMPTVQRPVRDFITSLPMNWVNGGTTFHRLINSKSINRRFHKRALSRYLKKEEIYNRSFDIPWYNILRPRKHVLELLKKALIKRGWYNRGYLESLFTEFESQTVKDYELLELKHHGYRIFTLLSLEVWAKLYLDGHYRHSFDGCLEDFLNN